MIGLGSFIAFSPSVLEREREGLGRAQRERFSREREGGGLEGDT